MEKLIAILCLVVIIICSCSKDEVCYPYSCHKEYFVNTNWHVTRTNSQIDSLGISTVMNINEWELQFLNFDESLLIGKFGTLRYFWTLQCIPDRVLFSNPIGSADPSIPPPFFSTQQFDIDFSDDSCLVFTRIYYNDNIKHSDIMILTRI